MGSINSDKIRALLTQGAIDPQAEAWILDGMTEAKNLNENPGEDPARLMIAIFNDRAFIIRL